VGSDARSETAGALASEARKKAKQRRECEAANDRHGIERSE
jgi:hypothetical protein